MDYCWLGWIWVIVGTILVAIGGLIATYGWELRHPHSSKRKHTLKSTLCVVGGTIAVAFGGLSMTKGWNVISLGDQRNNLIRAIAQELWMNVRRLESPPIKGEVYYRKENGGLVPRPFPTLKTSALNAVMSSGLWDIGNKTEEKFLSTITVYEMKIGTANLIFDEYNDFLLKILDPNEKIASAKKFQKVAPEKDYFISLENKQNEVIKQILSEYKWSIPPKEREFLLQRIGEKSSVGKSE